MAFQATFDLYLILKEYKAEIYKVKKNDKMR